jgi:hypothetical protein
MSILAWILWNGSERLLEGLNPSDWASRHRAV